MLLICLSGLALNSRSESVDIEGAVMIALRHNHGLAATRHLGSQAEARLQEAGRWPNPELRLSAVGDAAFDDAGERTYSVGVAQAFPVSGRLALARDIGRLDVGSAVCAVRDAERLLIAEVQKACIRVLAAQEQEAVHARVERAAAETLMLARQRLDAGQAAPAEPALALSAHTRALGQQRDAEIESADARAELRMWLGIARPLDLVDSLTAWIARNDGQNSRAPSSQNRPDLDALALNAERAALEIRQARAEAWDTIDIGVDYLDDRRQDAPRGMGESQYLGVSASIPLPLWDRKQGKVAQHAALREEAEARLRAARWESAQRLEAARRTLPLLEQRVTVFTTGAASVLNGHERELTQGVAEGRIDLADLLAVRMQVATLDLEGIRARAALAEALVDIQAQAGSHPALVRSYEGPAAAHTSAEEPAP